MKKLKRASALLFAVCILSMCTITAFAISNQTVIMSQGTTNSIKAGFMESCKGTGDYGTDPTKVVKQCYVRLQEGSYDSGRVYSDIGDEKGGEDYIWAETSKSNNILHVCYTHYGWFYY